MKYDYFVEKAILQDKRNKFKKSSKIKDVPKELVDFYLLNNPVDVEVSMKGRIVAFFDYKVLPKIQKEYNLEDRFVFASCNGEPIYINDGKIFTCTFGKKGMKETKLADSFDSYLGLIDSL